MNLDRYHYHANESFFEFLFESEGPKGKIKKIARFKQLRRDLYNFSFGDLNEETGELIDKVVSNNGDGNKILATVAAIIYDFTDKFDDAVIHIKGSTPARTRWYQINITKYLDEICPIMEVQGYRNNKWEHFQKGYNYEAFVGQTRSLALEF